MQDIYSRQKDFNKYLQIFITKKPVEWQLTFIHGLQNEIAELLEHIDWHPGWKGHAKKDRTIAVGLEMADITKYVLCLWQALGFSYQDMIQFIDDKSSMVKFRAKQKFQSPLRNRTIVFLDLDGTIADWRKGFLEFLWKLPSIHKSLFEDIPKHDPAFTLCMDLDFGWSYSKYKYFKDKFEQGGGYATLPPFADAVQLLQLWSTHTPPPYIVACTARPVNIARVYYDTFKWLDTQDLLVDELHLVGDERVQLAVEAKERGNTIIMLEDNPELAMRAAVNDLHVVMRAFPYNESAIHYNIHRTEDFATLGELIK